MGGVAVSATHAIAQAVGAAMARYQQRWLHLAFSHPYLAHLGGRQIRKDTTYSGGCVWQCLTTPHKEWQAFSCTDPKAQEFLGDCRRWNALFTYALERAGLAAPKVVTDNAHVLAWDNGASIKSRSPTVRSAVGIRGSVLLNEVGVIPHAQSLYEAAYPIVSEARSNGKDAQMIVISNASRKGTWWHRFWTSTVLKGKGGWRGILTTWEGAKRALGWTRRQIEKARKRIVESIGVGAFGQWYECKWRSPEEGFFSHALLEAAAYDPGILTPEDLLRAPQTIGYDIGRRVHPAAWARCLLRRVGREEAGYILPTEVKYQMPYPAQRQLLASLIGQRRTRTVYADSTGQGDPQVEELVREFKSSGTLIKGVNFGGQGATHLFEAMRDHMQSGRLYYDRGDLDLRIEMEGIEAHVNARGQESVAIPEDSFSDGGVRRIRHGDRAVAAALSAQGLSQGRRQSTGVGVSQRAPTMHRPGF